MNNIGDFVPLPITQDARIIPLGAGIEPIDKRDQTLSLYDPDIRNPYIQNLTLSLTRNIGNNLTVDVRYIGTLSRKNVGQVNLNAPNFMNLVVNPTTGSTWVDELNIVRAGGQSATLNGMFPNGQITGVVFPAFPVTTFSDQLRGSYMTWQSLANGDFGAIANFLSTDNGTIPTATASSQKGLFLSANGQPANLFYTNPQYAGANVFTNRNHSNYHSMQAQVTMRPTRGLSFQATYTWSRNIGNPGSPTDWRDPGADYWLLTQHRSHSLSTYGTFDLPFGANGFMFRNASGALKKAVEGWQLSWITSMTTGLPGNVSVASGWTSNNTLWNNAAANLVGPFDPKSGTVTWEGGAPDGRYFGNKYMKIPDPICSDPTMIGQTGPFSFIPGLETLGSVASNCSGASGLKALALVSGYDAAGNPIPGEIIFQNALPGTRGNYQGNSLTGPGRLSVDMAISKSIEFMEGKRIDFRVDAQNIFNHATPSNGATAWNARFTQIYNPSFALNDGTDFGFISTKAGHRTFQAKIRISF
jgi:hypothetical protein